MPAAYEAESMQGLSKEARHQQVRIQQGLENNQGVLFLSLAQLWRPSNC